MTTSSFICMFHLPLKVLSRLNIPDSVLSGQRTFANGRGPSTFVVGLLCAVLSGTMPGLCCRCNGNGKCIRCGCARAGRACVDCLPSRKGHCMNGI